MNITEINLIFYLRLQTEKDGEASGCCHIEDFCRFLQQPCKTTDDAAVSTNCFQAEIRTLHPTAYGSMNLLGEAYLCSFPLQQT